MTRRRPRAMIAISNRPTSKITSEVRKQAKVRGNSSELRKAVLAAANHIKSTVRLNVLILGPAPSPDPVYRKREQIRDLVSGLGHDAFFPEDLLSKKEIERSGLDLTSLEELLVRKADYIVCLMASPGTVGEAHDFASDDTIAKKMMICIDRAHTQGYSGLGLLRVFVGNNGILHEYRGPQDIVECNVASAVIKQVNSVAMSKRAKVLRSERPST
jgi:hypothetical protein